MLSEIEKIQNESKTLESLEVPNDHEGLSKGPSQPEDADATEKQLPI
jgi:hypothetical protein